MAFALAAIGVVVPGAAGASAATCRTTQPPNAGTHANVLLGVTAVSSRNAWAIGFYDGVAFRARSLIEHWNGHAWKLEASPNPQGSDDSVLYRRGRHLLLQHLGSGARPHRRPD